MTAGRRWEIGAAVALLAAVGAALGLLYYRHALDRALAAAMEARDRAAVRALLRRGAGVEVASPGFTPLLFAVREDGDPELVRWLLDRGADVDGRGQGDTTPLIVAGRDEVRRELLRRGARVDAQDSAGNTALMLAAWTGDATGVRTLLEHGADPNLRNRRGWTALTPMQGLSRIITMLRRAGGRR